jgi:AraC-like DNA-binding protein
VRYFLPLRKGTKGVSLNYMNWTPNSAGRPAAHTEAPAVCVTSFSTDAVPLAQRIDYWHSGVLRRLDAAPGLDESRPFKARLTRLTGFGGELLDHSGSAQLVRRDAARCRADGRDDISLNFMVLSPRTSVTHGAKRLVLRTGDIMIIDSAKTTEVERPKHRAISLFIPRATLNTICPDPGRLAGRLIRPDGVAVLLRSHLQATMDNATHMQPEQQSLAMDIAMQLALATLSAEAGSLVDAAVMDEGLYQAAKRYIAQDCTNFATNPLSVERYLNCSRTGLYRAFAQHGESVSSCIWSARLAHARQMLSGGRYSHLPINEIAFRSGFVDHSTFDRMFKRVYGMTPKDMRQMSLDPSGTG